MKDGPMALQNDLLDWKLDNVNGRRAIFYKGKNYILQDQGIWWDIVKIFMIMKWQITLEN